MTTLLERIEHCKYAREAAAVATAKVFENLKEGSEIDFVHALSAMLQDDSHLFEEGWYSPPLKGMQFLFGSPDSNARLTYDSLRKPEHWPSKEHIYTKGSVGAMYASPVHKDSGVFGDFGLSVYAGDDVAVQGHIRNCMESMEQVIATIDVGMNFIEIYERSQELFGKNNLTNEGMLALHDPLGNNLGHTVPWSYEDQTEEELAILATGDMENIKDSISKKRLYINKQQDLVIPATFGTTYEARLLSTTDSNMPNIFFHYIILFRDGTKEVLGGFNETFQALGMDSYITSNY